MNRLLHSKLPAFATCLLLLLAAVPRAVNAQTSTGAATPRTRLVILGAAAGRSAWHGIGAGSMSAAIQVNKDVYLVDFGSGWLDAFFQTGLAGPGNPNLPGGMETLRAGFITHLHADHVADYARLIQFGSTDGLQKRKTPVEIYGPGRVADGTQMFPHVANPGKLMRPDNPAPGTRDMTQSLLEAYASDINDNMSDGGRPEPETYLDVHDITLPPEAAASPQHPSPRMAPFQVYKDENVTVWATLVNHAPMFPAFGFRFDTPDGVIVFSGDTGPNENLAAMAKGADILVHEAEDMNFPRRMLPEPRSVADEAKLRHLLEAHTDVAALGPIAREAGVKLLVLTHLGPPTTPDAEWLAQIDKSFTGLAVVGRRLFSISLPLP